MSRHPQRGFSLLELLVTLIVIVLVTSLVTLNVGDGGRDIVLRSTMDRLADTANYALDEAQFVGWDFGLLLSLESDGGEHYFRFDWLERGPSGWRKPVSGKEVFAGGVFPEGMEIQMYLDDVLQDQELFTNMPEEVTPQLVFYASGETMPGILEFVDGASGDVLWHMEWDLLGNFRAGQGARLEEAF